MIHTDIYIICNNIYISYCIYRDIYIQYFIYNIISLYPQNISNIRVCTHASGGLAKGNTSRPCRASPMGCTPWSPAQRY